MPNLPRPEGQGQAIIRHDLSLRVPCTELRFWVESVSAARSLREKVIQLQRASLNKVAMAYRDVAAKVARLLSGTPQLDLLAMERLVFYRERDRGGPRTAHRRELRTQIVNTWQARFNDGRRRYG